MPTNTDPRYQLADMIGIISIELPVLADELLSIDDGGKEYGDVPPPSSWTKSTPPADSCHRLPMPT